MLSLVFLILLFVLCFLLRYVGLDYDYIQYIFVSLSLILFLFYIFNLKIEKKYKILLSIAIFLRIALVYVDVNYYRLPNAGTDDDGFYLSSISIFENFSLFSSNLYGGLFPKILSIIYLFIGPNRFSIQYFNAMISILSIICCIKALKNYKLDNRYIFLLSFVLSLIPNALIINSILRRENIIQLFLSLSILNVSKWNTNYSRKDAIGAVIFFAISSLFHTALIFGVPILIAFFVLYDKKKEKIDFSLYKNGKLIIVLLAFLFIGLSYLTTNNNKFSGFLNGNDIYESINRSRGGSAYLTNLKINNIGQFVIYSPLKFVYFILSPMPWDFRNIIDIITFLSDSLVYLYLFVGCIKNKKNSVSKLMMFIFVAISFVFALGTFTSGTATRHRFTVLPFLVVSYCIAKNNLLKKEKFDVK